MQLKDKHTVTLPASACLFMQVLKAPMASCSWRSCWQVLWGTAATCWLVSCWALAEHGEHQS
jgi:hypothetical protein